MKAIHFTEMLRQIDQAYQHRALVDVYAYKCETGAIVHYKGWLVHHVAWRQGFIRLKNPKNRELRTIPQIFIIQINNQKIYL